MHRVRRSRMTAHDTGAIWDRWRQGQPVRAIAHAPEGAATRRP